MNEISSKIYADSKAIVYLFVKLVKLLVYFSYNMLSITTEFVTILLPTLSLNNGYVGNMPNYSH